MSEEIIVVELDEAFCDCCNVLWKTDALTEDALTGQHLCQPCVEHGEKECPIVKQLFAPKPEKFRADLYASVTLLSSIALASEEETKLLEDILDSIDCYLSFFRKDEDYSAGLCEFDALL